MFAGSENTAMKEMNLYAWQPQGHGELSFFVMADSEEIAAACVMKEIVRRLAHPIDDPNHITRNDVSGFGTDYYKLTVATTGEVITNAND